MARGDVRGVPARAGVYTLLTLGLLLVAGPFLWSAISSFKPEQEIRRETPTLWPQDFTLDNFRILFERMDVASAFLNSVLIAAVVVASNLLFCSLAGYSLTKLPFRGRGVVFGIVMVQMMVPGIVLMTPQFVLTAKLGLVDTLAGIAAPFLVAPLGVFLMRQFISQLPDELIQAARIDGAGEFRIFFKIILPLCKPALATLGLITFVTSWNNFLWPAVVAQSQDKYTLPVALALFSNFQQSKIGLLLAGSVIVVAPVVLLFLALQRLFIQGVATTGLK